MAELLTPKEIEELAAVARNAYHEGIRLGVVPPWRQVVLAVLRRRREMALEELARALEDPNSTASKLREELCDLRCAHCGRRLEEEA